MKILIISHYYKHKNAMASVRPMKLAKYFSRAGHDVTVLTSMQKDNWCKQELTPEPSADITEIYAPSHKGMNYLTALYDYLRRRGERKAALRQAEPEPAPQAATASAPAPSGGLKSKIKATLGWLFYYSCDRLENYFLAKGLINSAKAHKLSDFDVVIATYPGAGVHTAGEWFKKHRRTRHFIADYRDPAYNPGGRSSRIELRHDKRVQDQAVKYADGIVCVSHGMADSLRVQYPSSEISEVFVVNNGFDRDDNLNSEPVKFDDSKFNFVYTGALYQGRRTVEMLAEVLRKLIDAGTLTDNDFAFNYAGPDYDELLAQLRPFGLEKTAVDFGYVSRAQSLGMQEQSDAVLLLNWNDDNYTGVIPGKLYEYMSSGKPIVALITGNRAGSESAQMIEQCGLGCACEKASPADMQKLQQYIARSITEFKNGTRPSISSESINMFEYSHIAQKYLEVIDRVRANAPK